MAPTFKIVVVFLASLQLAQLASISNKYYDTKDLNSPSSEEFAFHSRFSVLSSFKTKQSAKNEQVKSKEKQNADRGSVSLFRSKRQLDQDAEIDAEIISNDPKMFSYGKSMPMTTSDDEVDEHHHENLGSDSWNEDVDTSQKNSLGGLDDTPENDGDEEQGAGSIQPDRQESTFHSQFQDISSANHAPTPNIASQDNLETTQNNSSEIRVVPTLLYTHPVSIDSDIEEGENRSPSVTTGSELQDSAHIEDGDYDEKGEVIANKEHFTPNTQDLEDTERNFQPNYNHKKIEILENVEKDADTAVIESMPHQNEMEKDAVKTHLSGATKLNEEEGEPVDKVTEQIHSKELNIDAYEPNEHLDNEDAEVFMPLPVQDSGSKAASGQLKLLEEDSAINSDEGSGDMESDPDMESSHETLSIPNSVATNNTANHPVVISSTRDSINFNIDSDADDNTKEESEYVHEDETEVEAPIADPTDIGSKVNDSSKSPFHSEENDDENHEELPITDPTEENEKVGDPDLTYDPKTIINPFNIDNASEISRNLAKAIGIIDSSEETTEGEESEGSGNSFLFHDTDSEKNSLENGAMFKFDPRMLNGDIHIEDSSDSTTSRDDSSNIKEVTEEPVVVRHHDVQFNAAQSPVNEDDVPHSTQTSANADEIDEITIIPVVEAGSDSTSHSSIDLPFDEISEATPTFIAQIPTEHGQRIFDTVSISENGSALPQPAGINEMGIQKSEKTASTESAEETSSSSTGSFIVLGAIMATIVALLGYSVIKSQRQKQQNSRRPPEGDIGTELKEIDTLLSGRNGHGPTNMLNIESDRLLNPGEESDKNESKPDCRNSIYQNGVHGENGKVDQPTNVLQIVDPNDVSELKIQPLNTIPPNNIDALNPQVANGFGLKNSPRNSDHRNQTGEPKSPPANNKEPRNYGTKPETAKIKMFIDHDSIPKTPIVIVKRGPTNVEM